ncbi:DUF4105 domain-containing protein [Rhizosphaericola mali]|uniref:DUF4105 domain-containing protein n=1 Tax=Rhizosphaericola mali TaxID=2545455 RepID=A0A5P2G2A1_9BACT|nr:DUF4105 domain-containing protein [Rhizosphaericola mali]
MSIKKVFVFLFTNICLFAIPSQAQTRKLRISILTCAPGPELYSTFGHTAIRIIDSTQGSDIVYNYGVIGEVLNYDDPVFYIRFMRGKLKYMLDAYSYSDFLNEYQMEQRSVWEQELNLTEIEKQTILDRLTQNLIGANKFYKYDFWLDNCSTRPRDILLKTFPNIKITKPIIAKGTTPRMLIHNYLDKAGQSWSKLGIDLLLGSLMDKPIDDYGAMFLPDYFKLGLDNANIGNQKLVKSTSTVLNLPSPIEPSNNYAPLIFTIILAMAFVVVYYFFRKNIAVNNILDSLFLFLTGLLGVLLFVMWTCTDHTVCKENYNLLWAMPFNIIVAFSLIKNRKWHKAYFVVCFLLNIVLIGGWFWLPQQFNIALLPIILLITYRDAYRIISLQKRK